MPKTRWRWTGRHSRPRPAAASYFKTAAVFAMLHLVMALGSLAVGLSIGLKRWDVGSAGMLESAAYDLAAVLFEPGAELLALGMPGEFDWMIILGNSVLWGAVGALVLWGLRRARG